MRCTARRFDNAQPITIEATGGHAESVDSALESPPWVAPAFVDLQVNGYGGQEFSSEDLTPDKVTEIALAMEPFGVTRFCPTVTTQHADVLRHALQTIDAACQGSPDVSRRIAGVHLEGPYITTEDGPRGAHPRQFCKKPDWDEFQTFQEAAGGRIRLLTMSVEFDESPPFIERVVRSGVAVSIGHTAAGSAQIARAVEAGASMSTHLGNGSHPMLPRHNNYIWDQLAEDRLTACLIVDGHHLPPSVVRSFVRAKTLDRCILVSDMSGLSGLPPGRYDSSLCDLEILADGRLVIAGQRELLAGASLPIGVGVVNVMRFAGIDLEAAIRMAVHHPAAMLGLEPAGLESGDRGDFVLFDLTEPDAAGEPTQLTIRRTLLDAQVC